MDLDNNDNILDDDIKNSFYQLLKKQATEFELFGQRLQSEIQNSYQEFIKLQEKQEQQNLTQINHEKTTDFQKSQKIINEITKLSNSQTQIIESLKARVEELENESFIKDQDIKKLRKDLELNKLRIKKFDTKGKSIEIVDEKLKDYDEIWNYEGLNWEDNVNENFLNSLKTTHDESSSSYSSNNNVSSSQINQIHARVQKIINRRENLGKKVKKKNFKILAKDFTRNDLIQYTKSEYFNSLKDNIKGNINKLLKEIPSNSSMTTHAKSANSTSSHSLNHFSSSQFNSFPQGNQETTPVLEKLHSQIQQIVIRKGILDCRVRLKDLKPLKSFYTINNFIQYTKTSQFNSLDNNTQRLMNLLIYETLSKELEQRSVMPQNLDEYIGRGVIPELPSGYKNYTEYEKSDMFNKLNRALRRRVSKLVLLEKRLIIP
ncbi:hypothetical protein C1645_781964 [Glomus cerebriforme]|uniref:Uncharacterized protein n=1 Tax=Glomus cerebriforme TaxID=658196 RepID=A0A397SIF0_9GLOM|nr:hypothetical protein C1645_781964 [Glomus cerebriforme]